MGMTPRTYCGTCDKYTANLRTAHRRERILLGEIGCNITTTRRLPPEPVSLTSPPPPNPTPSHAHTFSKIRDRIHKDQIPLRTSHPYIMQTLVQLRPHPDNMAPKSNRCKPRQDYRITGKCHGPHHNTYTPFSHTLVVFVFDKTFVHSVPS